MKLYEYIDKDGRKRKGIKVTCESCEETFVTRRDQPAKYCCKQCCREAKKATIVQITCANCGEKFGRDKQRNRASKSGLFFCSRKCKDKAQRIGGIKEIMPPHYGQGKYCHYREYFEVEELVCARCEYNEFIPAVEIHHIDRDRENNDKSNLIPLCACCHRALHQDCWKLEEITGSWYNGITFALQAKNSDSTSDDSTQI